MKTEVCEMLGIDIPLFAFSHCRDVVAAVTNAGGFGVLGASSHSPQQLEHELTWIDAQVGGKPYGADILVPSLSVDKDGHLSDAQLAEMIPAEYHDFVATLLTEHGIDPTERTQPHRVSVTETMAEQLMEVTFSHPIKLIASALGVPPPAMLEAGRANGVPVAALVGAPEHALKQVDAGVDILVAQGTEAGGHCGEITTLVLVPEVIEAIRPVREVPVLAAGGIVTGRQMAAAVAMGAAGAWTGSVWLTTEEAETAPHTRQKMLAATSRDTVRSRGRTGKYSRQLRSDWTQAWESGGSPQPLPMPLQAMISEPLLARVDALAAHGHEGAQALATYWVGQGVGLMNSVKPAKQVVYEFAEDYLDATARLTNSLDG
jgi:NAD(P)H-dependent flavin oxidoreductase YrpB (nitropropane dioxygenase family)